MRGIVASLVTVIVIDTRRRLDPWLVAALVATISKGLRSLEAGALAILPPFLTGGVEGIEQRFAAELSGARDYEKYLESFYSSRD